MKPCIVFYSWQSDIPRTRAFIGDTLKLLPDKAADIAVVEVQRDTVGIAGSPDISASIFRKIDTAALFIADVTIVDPDSDGRKTPNPNVLVELGYALKALGDSRIVLLCNTDNGDVGELPFDINHRRIISFSLEKEEKTAIRKRIINGIMKNIQILKEQGMLSGNARGAQEAGEALAKVLWHGFHRAWDYYKARYLEEKDEYEEEFVTVLDSDMSDLEKVKGLLTDSQYFELRSILRRLRSCTQETEDMYGWEYADELIRKYVEPLYLEFGKEMPPLPLEQLVTEPFVRIYNALSPDAPLEFSPEKRYQDKRVLYNDGTLEEAYAADGSLLCKGKITPSGFAGFRKTDDYIGEFLDGEWSGPGDEMTEPSFCFPRRVRRSGEWSHGRFVRGTIYDVVAEYPSENSEDLYVKEYEEGLPLTAGCQAVHDLMVGLEPGECKKYYLVDMKYDNGEKAVEEGSRRPLCERRGGEVQLFCWNCFLDNGDGVNEG